MRISSGDGLDGNGGKGVVSGLDSVKQGSMPGVILLKVLDLGDELLLV